MPKIRLSVKVRKDKHGAYIASVPMKHLVELSGYCKRNRHWSYEDGWLILDAY